MSANGRAPEKAALIYNSFNKSNALFLFFF